METLMLCVGIGLMLIGLLGCFVYKIPGPLLAFIGVLCFQFGTDYQPFTTTSLILCALMVVACKLVEKYAQKFIGIFAEFGKGGRRGCTIGSLLGIFIVLCSEGSTGYLIFMLILGLVVIPFVCALIGEYIVRKDKDAALKAGIGAFVNYVISTVLQLAVCIFCLYTAFGSMGEKADAEVKAQIENRR